MLHLNGDDITKNVMLTDVRIHLYLVILIRSEKSHKSLLTQNMRFGNSVFSVILSTS